MAACWFTNRADKARALPFDSKSREGGANVMSPDYFDAWDWSGPWVAGRGEILRVDQYWTRVIDYGFSS